MEDYREKLENLSKDRLLDLIERYEETVQGYEQRLLEAQIAGMTPVAVYQESELVKKRTELAALQKILASKEIEE